MKLGVLFSGGKDSTYAVYTAMKTDKVVCLISILSENKESYMFHTPNIKLTELQAEAMDLPLIQEITKGEEGRELTELKKAIEKARENFGIEGVVSGAVESVYQATRIQKICDELGLWCFNPLWKKDQKELIKEMVKNKFNFIISGFFAHPFDVSWLGKKVDAKCVKSLLEFSEKHKISPTGEGGEIETFVMDCPIFNKKIKILDFDINTDKHSGVFVIKNAILVKK